MRLLGLLLALLLAASVAPAQVDVISEKIDELWRRNVLLRLHFVDTAGRPVDGVAVTINTWSPGGWEGRQGRIKVVAKRLFERDLAGVGDAEMMFEKKGYYKNALDVDFLDRSEATALPGGKLLVERTITLVRVNEPLPEMQTNRQLALECEMSANDSTMTLIDVLAERKPKAHYDQKLPLTALRPGIVFMAVSRPGIEVRQHNPYDDEILVDYTPRDAQVVMRITGGEEGDGFVRAHPAADSPCVLRFPTDMVMVPDGPLEPEAQLTPADYKSRRNLYWYFRFKGHYGKLVIQPDIIEIRDGFWHLSVPAGMSVNAKVGDRHVLTPPCE